MSRPESAKKVLAAASIALDDWLHTYADDMCDQKYVKESFQHIGEHGGTIAYIADLQSRIRKVLGISASKHPTIRRQTKRLAK